MSFGGSHWCRSTPDHEHRSTVPSPNRSIGSPEYRSMTPTESTRSCNAVRILTHEEFAVKHPHPPNPDNIRIARHAATTIVRQTNVYIDRQPTSSIDRRAPITYPVQMPKIDVARLNALRPKPKPSDNPPETVMIPSDDGEDSMEVDRVPMGRTLRKRKEKVEKHLKRGGNDKEKESFQKRVFRIPIDKPFEESYYTHRLWMFFRETREKEEDIKRMFGEAREKMRKRVTLKKKSDYGQFAIRCTVKGIEFPYALCDTGASVSILPRVMADHLGLQMEPSNELFTFVDCSQRNSGGIVRDLEVQIGKTLVPVDFHVLDIKLNWNSSLLIGRAFLSTVGSVCNLQSNQLCLTLIDPHTYYDPIPVKKTQTSSMRINDPGIIAACHCGVEYATEYLALNETHTTTSIDSGHQKSTDTPHEESIDSSPADWENDYYNPIMAVNDAPPETPDDLYDEEYRKKGILVYKFRPLKPEIQAQVETDSLLAEAYGKGTSSSRISDVDRRAAIDREIEASIERAKKKPFDVNMPPSIDRHPEFGRRAFDLFGAR
ncbi:hypothetical protein F2Q69_00023407 [Brassica cretica]|uniref:Aspartic peptidase DDI1-type domain-containing protein n=1 Tax=Brassica cretica TaxID=69181 RepID=A0A8S9QAH2_BRACR|nr:hypothetical protein F2Q69_00023407 [Brassica cretica]